MKTLSTLFISIITALMLTACGGSSAEGEAVESQSSGDEMTEPAGMDPAMEETTTDDTAADPAAEGTEGAEEAAPEGEI